MISDRISNNIPSLMKILNMVPILMHLCSFISNWSVCKLHKAARHPMKCDIIYDIKLFRTVYRRIYCRKFFMLSNQTLCYKIKCIRMWIVISYSSIGLMRTFRIPFSKIQSSIPFSECKRGQ